MRSRLERIRDSQADQQSAVIKPAGRRRCVPASSSSPPDVLEGRIQPAKVFDRTTNPDGVLEGYRAMNDRESVKVMMEF